MRGTVGRMTLYALEDPLVVQRGFCTREMGRRDARLDLQKLGKSHIMYTQEGLKRYVLVCVITMHRY